MESERSTILLFTLGTSWALLPEVLGFLAPERTVDLYANHPACAELRAKREKLGLPPLTEVWVVTTDDDKTRASLKLLKTWLTYLTNPPVLRVWCTGGVSDITTEEGVKAMRELVYRAALLASKDSEVAISLAGGRKTMGSDIQAAAWIFGARAVLHVVAVERPQGLDTPDQLRVPPGADVVRQVCPVVVGRSERAEILDVEWEGHGPVTSSRFPLAKPGPGETLPWELGGGESLCGEIEAREKQGRRLLWGHVAALSKEESHDNWRSLDRLPPLLATALRTTRVTKDHLPLLQALPKADLHRHLGGCLSLDAQIRVGQEVWDNLDSATKTQAQRDVDDLGLRAGPWPADWPHRLKGLGSRRAWSFMKLLRLRALDQLEGLASRRTAAVAALLVGRDKACLKSNLFDATAPRRALKAERQAFHLYEQPGELTGSALLGHEAAIQPYAREAVRAAREEGLLYAELRGSPLKYLSRDKDGALRFLELLAAALSEAQGDRGAPCHLRFIVIADRRRPDEIGPLVKVALEGRALHPDLVAGVDLAGDESRPYDIDALVKAFAPAFEECLPVTIHAGEGEPAANIWKAAYHLNADRVGHGLTLVERPELARRFADRGICLELCPTSNLEVVGYREERESSSSHRKAYPLRELMKLDLAVTLATDNPGISDTTLGKEYEVASSLAAAAGDPSGLTLWEALGLIRRGFEHAFLPAAKRRRIMREADSRIFALIEKEEAALLAGGR